MRNSLIGLFLILLIFPSSTSGQTPLAFAVLDTSIQSAEIDSKGQNKVFMTIRFEIWNEVHQTYSLLSGNQTCSVAIRITPPESFEACYPDTIILGNGIHEFNLSLAFELVEPLSTLSLQFVISSAPAGEIYNAEFERFNPLNPGETQESHFSIDPPLNWGVSPLSPERPLHFRFSTISIIQSYNLIPITHLTFASTIRVYNSEPGILVLRTFSPTLGYINFSSETLEIEQEHSFPFLGTDHCVPPGASTQLSFDSVSLLNFNLTIGNAAILNLTFFVNAQVLVETYPLSIKLVQDQVEIIASNLPLDLESMRKAKPFQGECPSVQPVSPLDDPTVVVSSSALLSAIFLTSILYLRKIWRRRKTEVIESLYPK